MLSINSQVSEYRAPLVEMTDENANRQNDAEQDILKHPLIHSAKESANQRRRNQANKLQDNANTIKNLSSCSSFD